MDSVSASVLRKAALWLATLLVLLQCGWVIATCALMLGSIPSEVFATPWPGLSHQVVLGVLAGAVIVGLCQILAVWWPSPVLTFIIGVCFTLPGALTLICLAFFAVMSLVREELRSEWWSWDVALAVGVWLGFAMVWSYIGGVMLVHAACQGIDW